MRHATLCLRAASGACAVALLTALLGATSGAAQSAKHVSHVPDFSGAFTRDDPDMIFLDPAKGRGPLREHPVHKHAGHQEGQQAAPFVGDPSDPLLKPWAAAIIKERAYKQIVDQEELLPAHSLCWPSGVPGALRLRETVKILQTPEQVTFLYQRDHQVRRVHMNVPHSANPKKSWYGESVGHYEGDTLVVDTIGLNDKTSVDWYGTPHSDAIHVVERYRLVDGGKTMEVHFTVEDPNTFNEAWSSIVHYRRTNAPIEEIVCAENNKSASTNEFYPVPIAAKADF